MYRECLGRRPISGLVIFEVTKDTKEEKNLYMGRLMRLDSNFSLGNKTPSRVPCICQITLASFWDAGQLFHSMF